MTHIKRIPAVLFLFATASWLAWGGGTVITSHLPAATEIVNINGTADGAAGYGPGQYLWYQPFDTSGSALLPEITVTPGTYSFRVINPPDAAVLFPGLTAAETNMIYTAWTYNSPWILDYLVFPGAALTNSSIPQIFDGAPAPNSFSSPAAAYNDSIKNGYYDTIRTGPQGRASTTIVTSYTFTDTETLVFVIPDYDVGDNGGGVSVVVAPVPVLNLTASGTQISLAWSTNLTGYALAQTTNLAPAHWSEVADVPVVTNASYSVTRPRDTTTNRFFRLQNP